MMICILAIAIILTAILPPIPPKYQDGNVWQPMCAPTPIGSPPKPGSH